MICIIYLVIISVAKSVQLVWGASCGAPTLIIPTEYHCHTIELGPGTGMMCSCTTSFCNSRMGALEMIARAEFGLTGRGVSCQQCRGEGGLCEDGADAGLLLDCGVGVETCSLAFSEETGAWARGCGLQGLTGHTGQVQCTLTQDSWLVCYCGGQLCNNRGRRLH